jgi:hypothetical protein
MLDVEPLPSLLLSPPLTLPYLQREELYPCPYSSIDWNAARNQIAKEDLYYPHPLIQVGPGGWGRVGGKRLVVVALWVCGQHGG